MIYWFEIVFWQAKEDVLSKLLNERGKDEKTPLHLAAEADKPDIVISLLNHGKI